MISSVLIFEPNFRKTLGGSETKSLLIVAFFYKTNWKLKMNLNSSIVNNNRSKFQPRIKTAKSKPGVNIVIKEKW